MLKTTCGASIISTANSFSRAPDLQCHSLRSKPKVRKTKQQAARNSVNVESLRNLAALSKRMIPSTTCAIGVDLPVNLEVEGSLVEAEEASVQVVLYLVRSTLQSNPNSKAT